MIIRVAFFVIMEFLCGSLMFSYWLGLKVKKDLKEVGDGNPGAFNLWQAAGFRMGILGILLDFMKGYLPLVILVELELVKGMAIVPVAIAPVLGHAFSPFMKFKGGKAIAVTFGMWSAVTRFEVSIAYAVILAIFLLAVKLIKKGKPTTSEGDGFMAVSGMGTLGIYLFARAFPRHMVVLWAANLIVLIYTNRTKLHKFFKNMAERHEHNDTADGT